MEIEIRFRGWRHARILPAKQSCGPERLRLRSLNRFVIIFKTGFYPLLIVHDHPAKDERKNMSIDDILAETRKHVAAHEVFISKREESEVS